VTTQKKLLLSALLLEAAHIGTLTLLSHPKITSNILQSAVALFAAYVCWHRARSQSSRPKSLWLQLSLAFLLWAVAQTLYLGRLLGDSTSWASASDVLWLLFPFPLVLVASRLPKSSHNDRASWLDLAQACLFFITLFALVFTSPAIGLSTAYEVQSIVLALAGALRYSIAIDTQEQRFYRNLAIFTLFYAFCSIAGYYAEDHGFLSGTLIDLTWTLPFTAFSVISLTSGKATARKTRSSSLANPIHLHGISALGLAAMSLAAGGVLVSHHHLLGGVVILAAFTLLATRTSVREWQMRRFQLELESSLLHDPLTGLANRALLQRELVNRLRSKGLHNDVHTAVLFLDLDRFKMINDALGHSFGDELLKQVAKLLLLTVRPQDVVARYGGDEFVLVLDQVNLEMAQAVSERILALLRNPITLDTRVVHVSASIGIVLDTMAEDADSLLRDSDCAMYKAKACGRDRAQIFRDDMLSTVEHSHALHGALREALTKHALDVHYQPIYSVEENSIKGFEALVRWQHPVRGMIAPVEFISLAEETGLIHELGIQVLTKACLQCNLWNMQFGTDFNISVNVSAQQFSDPEFPRRIVATLKETGLPPSLLRLEMTESVLLHCDGRVSETLVELRSLGISIALDDFGTGFSSLSYLLGFPFDILKIDKSFVQDLDRDPKRSSMVRTIIAMATILDMKVVAEGVERPEELECLRSFRCDKVQGYLLSRPLPPEAIVQLLATTHALTR